MVSEADDRALLDGLDKQRAYEVARQAGIGAPRTAVLHGWDDLERAMAEIGTPCALKPVHIHEYRRHFSGKVVLIDDAAALRRAFARTHEVGLDMILTEIIPGPEDRYCSYFTYLDEHGQPLFHFTKRKLRQYPVGFGGGTYHLTDGPTTWPTPACASCRRWACAGWATSSSSAIRATASSRSSSATTASPPATRSCGWRAWTSPSWCTPA